MRGMQDGVPTLLLGESCIAGSSSGSAWFLSGEGSLEKQRTDTPSVDKHLKYIVFKTKKRNAPEKSSGKEKSK